MSVKNLLDNNVKNWANLRINDLQLDGEIVGNVDFAANLTTLGEIRAEGGLQPSPTSDVLQNYHRLSYNGNVGGTFIVTPFLVTLQFERVGDHIKLTIPNFSIVFANQNASGSVSINLSSLPIEFVPSGNRSFPILLTDESNVTIVTKVLYNTSLNQLSFFSDPNTSTFTKNTSDVRMQESQTCCYFAA